MTQPCFFNAHHAPIGAFASFTLGSKGASGGLGMELGHPADQDVFIGLESAAEGRYDLLPFCSPQQYRDYSVVTSSGADGITIQPFDEQAIHREFRLGVDRWRAGDLEFVVYSQARSVADPTHGGDPVEMQQCLLPAVLAEMVVDNRSCCRSRKVFFGFGVNGGPGMRHFHDAIGSIHGVGQGRNLAICTDAANVETGMGFSLDDILQRVGRGYPQGGLGNIALIVVDVPAAQKVVIRFSVCFFHEGPVTAEVTSSYLYCRYFSSIEAVAQYGLRHFDEISAMAVDADRRTGVERLSAVRRFMLIHAIRSYYGSTQLLDTPNGPLWVVNEGEYRMINTLDLTIDHLFFELKLNPWTVRSVLDAYSHRYTYRDTVKGAENGRQGIGGLAFTHDMGVANVFSAAGCSAYERPGLTGLYSYMTHEQLVNWTLVAAVYCLSTGDDKWLTKRRGLLRDCLTSLVCRDHPCSGGRKGVMQRDSSMCDGGCEITTYDSLDPSLGQARDNGYGAVKRWAAFVLLGRLFAKSGDTAWESEAVRMAKESADAICARVLPDGTIPALFDPSQPTTVALPLAEGLIYPWFAGCRDVFEDNSPFAPFVAAIKRHTERVLASGVCRCADKGWKLTSGSDITWLSKLYLFRFIATEILGIRADDAFVAADEAHFRWLLDERNACFAWSDQFCNGEVVGSRYYPRGVTAVLWLDECRAAS